jgi:hypothetical protein
MADQQGRVGRIALAGAVPVYDWLKHHTLCERAEVKPQHDMQCREAEASHGESLCKLTQELCSAS